MLKPLLSLITGLLFSIVLMGQSANYDKIGPNLWDAYNVDPDQHFSFYIILKDQYDINELFDTFRESDISLEERAISVNKTLRTFATKNQSSILDFLSSNDIQGLHYYKPHWIINVVYVEANWLAIEKISTHPDIETLQLAGELVADATEDLGPAPIEVLNTEYTLFKINAHKMWELGYTGYGVTCLTADTGVDPYHPSIISQQRANIPNQFDHAFYHNQNSEYSFDCGDHGTHVTGTILGLDRLEDDTIGVAFNGQWMGAAVLCGIGTADNVDAFEWAMDPDNDPNTVEDMPAFINNSWYDPTVGNACQNIYVNMLSAVEAAGIGVVFSAGNEGSGSSTITNPKNLNMGLVNTFAVGALNNSGTDITNFSSRGPSQCFSSDSSLLIKPEVSAPGQSVRSCEPGGGYGLKSGTSMAAPHVAGALMLLKEAFPALSGETLKLALYYTAVDLGPPGEDNTFGMGIIDVFAAYQYLIDAGNTPKDPTPQTDLLVFGLQSELELCQSNIPCSFGIENGGAETITGIQYTVTLDGDELTVDLDALVLNPGERYFVDLDSISNKLGVHYLSVEVKQIDGAEDSRPLNDRIVTRINNKPLFPSEFTVENDELCVGGTVSISGEVGNDFNGYFEWYSDENLVNQIGEGMVLNMVLEDPETQVYAKTVVQEILGSKVQQAYLNYDTQNGKGMVIRPNEDLYFNTFSVYVESAGTVFFRIYDGDEIVKTIVNTLSEGVQELFVGLELESNREYEIQYFSGFAKLLSHDYDLPYGQSGDLVDILRATDQGGFEFGKYFFFYDMKFELAVDCNVERLDIQASNESSLLGLSFELPQTEFNEVTELPTVSPIANIEGSYSELLWDFGDGNTSTSAEPTHTYTSVGEFILMLKVWDADGCESVYSQVVNVENYLTDVRETEISEVLIYPNPFKDEVYIVQGKNSIKQIRLFDASGSMIIELNDVQEDIHTLKMNDLPSGVFFVQIWDGVSWVGKKLIKQ